VSRGPKSATVIPLEVLDPHLVAATLVKSRCLPIGATVEPLADEKALLVYADATTIKEIKDVLRMLGESVPAPKRPQTIPVPASFDVNEVTKAVKKLFPAKTVIVPLADEHSLLAYVTDEDAEVIRQAIRPFVEQQPAKTPSHSPMTAPQRPGPVRPVSP
jgi:hypothetical protein